MELLPDRGPELTTAARPGAWQVSRRVAVLDGLPAVALVGGSLAALGASHGGYFPSSWGWSALVFSWSGALALLVKRVLAVSRLELGYLAALTGLLGWTAASLLWTPTTTQTVYEVERTLSYVTFAVAVTLLVRRVDAKAALAGALAATTGLAAYGLLTRVLPGRLTSYDTLAAYRLDSPIGYWNAVGAVCAFGTVLALGLAARCRTPVARAAAATTTVVLVPTLYFTFGRGGWLALGVGLLAVLALDPRRLQLAATLLAVAPWPALAIWRAYESKGLTTGFSPLTAATADGRRFAWTLLALAAGAFACTFAFAALSDRVRVPRGVRLAFGALLAAAALAGVAGGLAAYGGPSHAVSKALDSIHRSTPNVRGDQTQRLFSLSTNGRLKLWSSALDDAAAHRWTGSGAGSFEEWWLRHRTVSSKVRDAHSLFVEQLAELGPPGLALLVLALGIPLVAAWRARRHPLVPAAAGGLVVFCVHAAADWDWEIPAVTLCGLAAAGIVLAAARRESFGMPGRKASRLPAVAALLAVSAFAFVVMVGNRALGQAQSAADDDNVAAAASHARTAARWTPWSADPIGLQADAALELGRLGEARSLYRQAIAKEPRDWEYWFGLALASEGTAQKRALAQASRLNPLQPEIVQFRKAT